MVLAQVVECNSEVLGGPPVFASTRVPIQILLDDLAAGQSLGGFFNDFPNVVRAQAVAMLDGLKPALLAEPNASAA